MKPLVKLVCASCGTKVGRIGLKADGSMVREWTEHNRYFHGGGSAPKGFPSKGAVAAQLIDKFEEVIDDPRAVRRSFERAGHPDLFDHPIFAYSIICWKCTAAISISRGDMLKALNAAQTKNKVRSAVLHPLPDQ